ncbi:MAG: hypothetical protein IID34_12810 [Planctomycetes bacterium]|nr:hypothetical protein [Planctomycetota bacterium]
MSNPEERTCSDCGRPLEPADAFCRSCGHAVSAPPTVPGVISRGAAAEGGDATGGLIPYKNVPALMAYYCGVFSIIPFFPIGIAAFVLGIIGLKRRKRNPVIRGAAHAWIGIIIGGLFGLIWTALTGAIIIAVLAG